MTDKIQKLQQALEQIIRGRSDTIRLVLTGLISGGHVLIEDYPGSGKTTLAKSIGKLIDCKDTSLQNNGIVPFRRIQFTPDLLPSDVLGVNVFEPRSATFRFQHGPIFANIVLADEINRTGPKVQAAFLECMAERQVTIDNITYPLDELFFVIGTQNPLDIAGTYPLPLVQLDRFLLKIPMHYVDRTTEIQILSDSEAIQNSVKSASPVITRDEVLALRNQSKNIHIAPAILETIADILQETRNNTLFQFGVSTRAGIMLKQALQAWALLEGREYVIEDDLKFLAPFVLMHRVKFHPSAGEATKEFEEFLKPHVERLVRKS
jgi:MoxR-like ATPase